MSVPQFNSRGVLDKGIYKCTPKEFIERFCEDGNEDKDYKEIKPRRAYKEVLEQLFAFVLKRGARSIIFGGSFITDKIEPNDVDCIVIFPNSNCIPSKDEIMIVSNCKLDIIYMVEGNKNMVYNFIAMFAKDRYALDIGLVEVELQASGFSTSWDDYEDYINFNELLLAREVYIHRHVIDGENKKGLLVTIHGINDDAKWNFDIAPTVSANNWIFAPFVYGNVKKALVSAKDTDIIVEKFREWIKDLYDKYRIEPCILAHSFGTYIIGKYIKEFNYAPPVRFNNIVLAGSILNENYDWQQAFKQHSVNSVLNIVSPNDPWVPLMDIVKKIKNSDKLYGSAGVNGFNQNLDKLFSEEIPIFNHGNMLEIDSIEKIILPYLSMNANLSKFDYDNNYIILEKFMERVRSNNYL